MEKMLNMFIMNYSHQCVAWNIKEQSSCDTATSLQYMHWYSRAVSFPSPLCAIPNTHAACLSSNCRGDT